MAGVVAHLDEMVSELRALVDAVRRRLDGKSAPDDVIRVIDLFYKAVKGYRSVDSLGSDPDILMVSSALEPAINYGRAIGISISSWKEADDILRISGRKLLDECNKISKIIDKLSPENNTLTESESNFGVPGVFHASEVNEKIRRALSEHEDRAFRVERLLDKTENGVSALAHRLNALESLVQDEVGKIKSIYDDSLKEIELKKDQINEILGHVSGRAIAGDFEKSAAEEKGMANWLRNASIFCMALIVFVLGFSVLETATADFQWEKSIFRVSLAFLLSVPAAYLARESAKHRQQQYQHLQTSLDLKAISPYIASLPESEQHKLKIEMASRIFAARDFSKVGADSYPLNTHEIIMELIKKLDFSRSDYKKSEPK